MSNAPRLVRSESCRTELCWTPAPIHPRWHRLFVVGFLQCGHPLIITYSTKCRNQKLTSKGLIFGWALWQ
jgi:hypothetical protein